MIEANGARGSQTSLREANTAAVVEAVRIYGQITQVELASVTGLSPATVSNLVKSLQSSGVVQTSATVRSGRRAQAVSLVRSSDLAVGVHVGRRSFEVLIADASWSVSAQQRLPLPVEHRYDTTLDRVALLVAELAEQVGASMDDVAAVGLAIPAPDGLLPEGLAGWGEVDAVDVLGRRLGRPVTAIKEADAVAVAESRYGALRSIPSALVIRAGHAIDGSIVIGGRPAPGLGSIAGAIGHMRSDPGGRICRCGARGCLNTLASVETLADLLRVTHGQLSLREIVQRANDGDAGCQQAVAHAAAAIGAAAADAAVLLAPHRICLSGELTATGAVFIDSVRRAMRSRPLLPDPDGFVVLAECEAPEARGALAIAADLAESSHRTEG